MDATTDRNLSLITDADLSAAIEYVEERARAYQVKAAKYSAMAMKMRDQGESAEEFDAAAQNSENAAIFARIKVAWLLKLTGERIRRAV